MKNLYHFERHLTSESSNAIVKKLDIYTLLLTLQDNKTFKLDISSFRPDISHIIKNKNHKAIINWEQEDICLSLGELYDKNPELYHKKDKSKSKLIKIPRIIHINNKKYYNIR